MRDQIWPYWPEPEAKPIPLTRKGLLEMIRKQNARPDAFVQPPGEPRSQLRAVIGTRELQPNVDAAREAYRADRLAESLAGFDYLLGFTEGIWEVHYHRGIIHYRMGNLEAARAAFLRCLNFKPARKQSVVLNNLAAIYAALDDQDRALQYLEQSVECSDAIAEASYNLSVWYEHMQAVSMGEVDYPEKAAACAKSANKLFHSGRSDRDAALFYPGLPDSADRRPLEIKPETTAAEVLHRQAKELWAKGKFEEAWETWQKARDLDPAIGERFSQLDRTLRQARERELMQQARDAMEAGDFARARLLVTASLEPLAPEAAKMLLDQLNKAEAANLRECAHDAVGKPDSDPDAALTDLLVAEMLDPKGGPDIERFRAQLERERVQPEIREIQDLRTRRLHDEALRRVDELMRRYPRVQALLDIRQSISAEKERDEEAKRRAEPAPIRPPDPEERAAEQMIQMARECEKGQRLEEAWQIFTEAEGVWPSIARRYPTLKMRLRQSWEEELTTRIKSSLEAADLSGARVLIGKLAGVAPEVANAWTAHVNFLEASRVFGQGWQAFEEGEIERARQLLVESGTLDARMKAQIDGALAAIERKLLEEELQPAYAALTISDHDKAEEILNRLDTAYPGNEQLARVRRQVQDDRLQCERARAQLAEARERTDEVATWHARAVDAEKANDFQTALPAWLKLTELVPDRLDFTTQLTACAAKARAVARDLELSERLEDAQVVLETLQGLPGDHPDVVQALQRVKEMIRAHAWATRWQAFQEEVRGLLNQNRKVEALLRLQAAARAAREVGQDITPMKTWAEEIWRTASWFERRRYNQAIGKEPRPEPPDAASEGPPSEAETEGRVERQEPRSTEDEGRGEDAHT